MSDPIITSLLDLDVYKFNMGYAAWRLHPDVDVTYAFKNRTSKVRLADDIPEGMLREQLEHVRGLRFRSDELDYLGSNRFFRPGLYSPGYLDFLRNLRMPDFLLEKRDGDYRLEVSGKWPEAIFWETLILSLVNELRYRLVMARDGIQVEAAWAEGARRLRDKIAVLEKHPGIKIAEFGTRRRFSLEWHRHVATVLRDRLPGQLLSISDVMLARELDWKPGGTMAHEMFMVYSGIYGAFDADLYTSHNKVLEHWRQIFGDDWSVALTDTFTTAAFFRMFTPEMALQWKALRQDSGDPFAFGETAIRFYEGLGIDPKGKTLVFSDGLDLDLILRLEERFDGRIGRAYGWGTNLTNDLGLDAISIVVKAVKAGGNWLVKLSDNPAKATGPAAEVARYLRVFGAVEGAREECRY